MKIKIGRELLSLQDYEDRERAYRELFDLDAKIKALNMPNIPSRVEKPKREWHVETAAEREEDYRREASVSSDGQYQPRDLQEWWVKEGTLERYEDHAFHRDLEQYDVYEERIRTFNNHPKKEEFDALFKARTEIAKQTGALCSNLQDSLIVEAHDFEDEQLKGDITTFLITRGIRIEGGKLTQSAYHRVQQLIACCEADSIGSCRVKEARLINEIKAIALAAGIPGDQLEKVHVKLLEFSVDESVTIAMQNFMSKVHAVIASFFRSLAETGVKIGAVDTAIDKARTTAASYRTQAEMTKEKYEGIVNSSEVPSSRRN